MPSLKSIFPCLSKKESKDPSVKETPPVNETPPVSAEQAVSPPPDLPQTNVAFQADVKEEEPETQHNNEPTDEHDDVENPEEEALKKYQSRTGRGRKSVAGERYNPEEDDDDEPIKVVPKSDEQRARLQIVSKKVMLLNRLDEDQLANVLDAMEERQVIADEVVIKQGDDGDNFYVIDSGNFDIYIDDNDRPNKVGSYDGSGFFGELALMYNMPRAATIRAVTDGVLWSLDRKTFRQIIVKANANKRKQFEEFLKSLSVLENINENERSKIADVMESQKFKQGDIIIRQGDVIDSASFVYFLMSGTCSISINSNGMEKIVKTIDTGACFGEVALITKEPRNATVTASSNVVAGVLDVNAFERLLGPCKNIMARNIDKYAEELAQISIKDDTNE